MRAEVKGVCRQLYIYSVHLSRTDLLPGLIANFKCLHWQIVQCNRSGSVGGNSTMQATTQYEHVHEMYFKRIFAIQTTAVAVPLMTF